MNIIRYGTFQEYLMRFQQRVHILIAPPLVVFVFMFIKIENGRFHPGLVKGNELGFIRMLNPPISILLMIAAVLYFTLSSRKIPASPGLRFKLDQYYRAAMIRNYLLEAGLILNLISLGLTGEKIYTGFFGIMLIVFLMGYPNMWRIISTLKLEQRDSDIIFHKEPIE
jgi:hypothetical protein